MVNAFFQRVNPTLASRERKRVPDRFTFDRFSCFDKFSPTSTTLSLLPTIALPALIDFLMLVELEILAGVIFNIKMSEAAFLMKLWINFQ